VPTAGHQGVDREVAFGSTWHRMLSNTVELALLANSLNLACHHAPHFKTSQPWQMVAVDILQVSLSTNNNRYLLVLHLTKWADAVPLPDQTLLQH